MDEENVISLTDFVEAEKPIIPDKLFVSLIELYVCLFFWLFLNLFCLNISGRILLAHEGEEEVVGVPGVVEVVEGLLAVLAKNAMQWMQKMRVVEVVEGFPVVLAKNPMQRMWKMTTVATVKRRRRKFVLLLMLMSLRYNALIMLCFFCLLAYNLFVCFTYLDSQQGVCVPPSKSETGGSETFLTSPTFAISLSKTFAQSSPTNCN